MATEGTGVYRAPMRSRDPAVPAGAAVERGLDLGLCGLGGVLPRAPLDLDEALDLTRTSHGERAAARLRRFAAVPVGATVWTRDHEGGLHRGALLGPWRYDPSAAGARVDLVHVRDCAWTSATQVPDAVLDSFARGGRNFQRIRALG